MKRLLEARRRLLQWACAWWTGHAFLLVIEPERLCVECEICGKTTTGWDVEFRAPQSNVVVFQRRRA